MARGGYRPGSGAKPGGARRAPKLEDKVVRRAKQKAAEAIAAKVTSQVIAAVSHDDGITPVVVMLETMRHLWKKAQPDPSVINGEMDIEFAKQAVVVAAQAAPYLHAKIAHAEAKLPKPPDTEPVDVKDVARRIAFMLAVSTQESKSLAVFPNSADNRKTQ